MTLPEATERGIRRWSRGLLLAYLLFVVYGSLVPLRFVDRPFEDALQAFRNIPFLDLGIGSRADWAANLLLFIPLAFLAGLVFNARPGAVRRTAIGLVIFALGVALALAIEFTQLYFPQRTVSQNDILAESLGGALGIALHLFIGDRARVWLGGLWARQGQLDRLSRVLHAYLLVLFAFNVLPLDLTISPVELFHKWSEGRVVLLPFAGLKDGLWQGLYETLTDIGVWVPAGLLWALGGAVPQSAGRVAAKALLAAAVIELLQLFVYSRVTDITDVLLAGVGGAAGWALARAARGPLSSLGTGWRRLLPWAWLLWALSAIVIFWFPFNFDFSGLNGDRFTEAATRLPFTTYYYTSEFHAINELLRKVGGFLPGGLVLGLLVVGRQTPGSRAPLWPLLAMAAAAACIETGQLALPGKVADVTDALLETLGGALGYGLALWIGGASAAASSHAAAAHQPSARRHPASSSGSPPASATASARTASQQPPWQPGYKAHLACLVGLFLATAALLRWPQLPYNVRELAWDGALSAVSAAGLSALAYGMANTPFVLAARRWRRWFLLLPFTLLAHGVLGWFLLRLSVPMEGLQDIVGAPVLDWPWDWEMLGRYTALHMALMLQLVGAVLLVRTMLQPQALADFLYWLGATAVLSWPLYALVVQQAATDNLTELMADDASFRSASALATAWFLTCVCAAALSAALGPVRRRALLLGSALAAAAVAAVLYDAGAEQTIVKYDKVFSAFQFLLSTDREHYAQGAALAVRFAAAFAFVTAGLAAMQWLSWRRLAGALPVLPAPRRRAPPAAGGRSSRAAAPAKGR